jgi:tetratricopeptide (TPR) repeat protein
MIGLLLVLVAFCTACTHPGHGRDLRAAAHLPEQAAIIDVPFFPQEAYQCGPAAMAMVLNWAGVPAGPEDLVAEVYTPGRQGSLQTGLITAARRHGRLAYTFNGPQKLLKEVAAGHPAIVMQNLGVRLYPAWHYAVVVGIDRPADEIVLHSGTDAWRHMAWSRLLFTWERSDYWGLVVLPPGRIPASADEITYLGAVVGLEQAGRWAEAATAYEAALDRWPASPGALIGLGNCHISMGNLPRAERALRRAVAVAPDNSDAANNLAHVLARRGHLEEALYWVRQALQIGGANASVYRETLREIEALQGP